MTNFLIPPAWRGLCRSTACDNIEKSVEACIETTEAVATELEEMVEESIINARLNVEREISSYAAEGAL